MCLQTPSSPQTVGSKDPNQFFLKGIFVQEGSSGTHFDHGQFEIKTFPIYSPPNSTCIPDLCCMGAVACAGCCERGVPHFHFPQIPKWGITCWHSPHCKQLAVKPSTGGVQGNAPGRGPGGGTPGSSWVLAL